MIGTTAGSKNRPIALFATKPMPHHEQRSSNQRLRTCDHLRRWNRRIYRVLTRRTADVTSTAPACAAPCARAAPLLDFKRSVARQRVGPRTLALVLAAHFVAPVRDGHNIGTASLNIHHNVTTSSQHCHNIVTTSSRHRYNIVTPSKQPINSSNHIITGYIKQSTLRDRVHTGYRR